MDSNQRNWQKLCRLDDIPRLGSRVASGAEGEIAIFRTEHDSVFALQDKCPHKGGPLSQGIVHGERVTCPLHGWNLELDTGHACTPDEGCAVRYNARVDDGDVWLEF